MRERRDWLKTKPVTRQAPGREEMKNSFGDALLQMAPMLRLMSAIFATLGAMALLYSALYPFVSSLARGLPVAPTLYDPIGVLAMGSCMGLALLGLAWNLAKSADNMEAVSNGSAQIRWQNWAYSVGLFMVFNGLAAFPLLLIDRGF